MPLSLSALIRKELTKEQPNYKHIREVILGMYLLENGSLGSEEEIDKWCNKNIPDLPFWGYVEKVIKIPRLFMSMGQKVWLLAQLRCSICESAIDWRVVSIQLPPISMSNSRLSNEFKRQVASLKGRPRPPIIKERICLLIVYLVSKELRSKEQVDVDNFNKVTVDSLKGIYFVDDSQIDHLTSFKIEWDGSEEYIIIRIQGSSINNHDNVILKEKLHAVLSPKTLTKEDLKRMAR